MSSIRTLRGILEPGAIRQLIDDGRESVGWVLEDFKVWQIDGTGGGDSQVIINYDPIANTQSNASSNREIAWALSSGGKWQTVVDPEHIILEEAYVNNLATSEVPANYLIRLRKIKISPVKRILAMLKARQQDDL